MCAWHYTAVSVIGTSHQRTGEPCQDASLCTMRNDGTLICAVSDGAGSAQYAEVGARIAVEHFMQWAANVATPAAIGRA